MRNRNSSARFSSEDKPKLDPGKTSATSHCRALVPQAGIACRQILECIAFVWNLTWGSSGEPSPDEESEYRSPSGPKGVPGIYTVRLTVDGQPQTQLLKVIMDPRSSATPRDTSAAAATRPRRYLPETLEARRALAEIGSVQKQLADH